MHKIKHYLNIVLNVSNHEWPRIILSWLLKLIIHASYVMGSTIIVALFVDQFSVERLPYMYICSAFFVVLGSFFFSMILERYEKRNELIVISIIASVLFAISPLLKDNFYLFYLSLFSAVSICIAQLNIIVALFIEELFSPLESERTFPIIESSEPVGGILAGAILYFSVTQFHLPAVHILFLLAGFLLLLVPVLIIFMRKSNKIPVLESDEELELRQHNRFDKAKKGLRHIKGLPFLKGMFLVVFLHFAVVNLIEFQYTTVLDHSLDHGVEASAHGESHADALTHGLAFWHVLFSICAFLGQILTASRIQRHLGVVKTMNTHPVLNFIMAFFSFLSFGYPAGIASRGIFEITTIMHRTTYHASFYALKKSIREHVKEFMEGMVRPLGVILGTLLLLVIQYFASPEYLHQVLSLLIAVIMLTMYIALKRMQSQYTQIAKKNLSSISSNIDKVEAIEILAQKGHERVTDILTKQLHTAKHIHVKKRIIETIAKIQDVNAIPDLLKILESDNKELQLAAATALSKYKNLGKHFFSQSFAKHRVIEALQNLFLTTKSKKIKSAVVQVFKNINNADIIPFLLKALENNDDEVKSDVIYVCGLFNDVNSAHYLDKYLNSKVAKIKSSAVMSLWNFPSYKLKCLVHLNSMLASDDINQKLSGIYTLGEIKAIQEIPRLEKLALHDNHKIRIHALIALAKMEQIHILEDLLTYIFHHENNLAADTKKLLRKVPSNVKKIIENLMVQEVSYRIHKILSGLKSTKLKDISTSTLKEMKEYYELISEIKEVLRIEEELSNR